MHVKLPQLTLRDLFWLVLVCALGCAWGLDHFRFQDERYKLDRWPKQPGDKLEVSVDEVGVETTTLVGRPERSP